MSCQIQHRYQGGSTAFNGTTSTIPTTLTSNDVFKTGNGFTMWRWINPKNIGESGSGRIIDKTDADNGTGGVQWRLGSGNLAVVRIGNTTSRASADNSINFNRWQLALVTVAPDATVTHYINNNASGTPAATGALSGITTANPLTIGNRSTATDRTFDGLLGEGGICPRVLTEAERTAIFTGTQPIPSGTAHHWTLDEVTGVFVDTIGGATGTGTATTYSTDTPVQMKTAIDWEARSSLSFDGVDDYVRSDVGNLLNSGYTMQGIIRRGQKGTAEAFFRSSGGDDKLWFNFDTNDTLRVYHSDLTPAGTNTTITYASPSWLDCLATYDGSVVSIYVNAQLVAKRSVTGTLNIPAFLTMGSGSSQSMKGNCKSARIWNRALTKAEIIDLHFNNIVPTSGLVLNLPMNEGAGTIAYDSSGNGNNGTITGATWSAELPNAPLVPIVGNLVKNGDFSYVPVVNVAQTADGWLDGTAGGAGTGNVPTPIGLYVNVNGSAQAEVVSDSETTTGKCIKLSTTGVATSYVQLFFKTNYYYGRYGVNDTIPVKPSTAYRYSFKMKTLYVSGDSEGASLSITEATGTKTGIKSLTVGKVKTTTDWTTYSGTLTTDANTRYIGVLCQIYGHTGAGTLIMDAWFDEIELNPTTPVVNIPLSAPAVAITCP